LEKEGESIVFLYRDLRDKKKLGLFFIHGKQVPSQPMTKIAMTIAGAPEGTEIKTTDDAPSEFDWTDKIPGVPEIKEPSHKGKFLAGNWYYGRNTDGAALNLPITDDWTLEIKFKEHTVNQVKKWRYYFGGAGIVLDMKKPLYISSKAKVGTAPTVSDADIEDEKDEKKKVGLMQQRYCGDGNKKQVVLNQKAKFCALATSKDKGKMKYHFAWGDESTKVVEEVPGKLACSTHTWTAAGREFKVTVEVEDGKKCRSPPKPLGTVCVVPSNVAAFSDLDSNSFRQLPSAWTWSTLPMIVGAMLSSC